MKKIILMSLLALSLTMMTGCNDDDDSSKGTVNQTYSVDEVKSIAVTTDVNNVEIASSSDDEISVSLEDSDDDICSLSDSTLTVDVPEPDTGINFKDASTLYINIPSDYLSDSITITTTNGNITIDSITSSNLSVTTQYGNIETKNIAGSVVAKSEMGELSTSYTDADTDSSANAFNGTIGSDSADCSVNLVTNVGDITLG